MSCSTFEEHEDRHQKHYDDIKLPFKSAVVVSVTLLHFNNISNSASLYIDIPDPQFEITCPQVKQKNLRSFKTLNIKDNVTSGDINEQFKFVLPDDHDPDDPFHIIIKLSDRNVISALDEDLGEQRIDLSNYEIDAEPQYQTLKFGENNGFLELRIQKQRRTHPDFRFGLSLCQEERKFRKKRIPFVHKAMNELLGDKGPKDLMETPIVSVVGSGGGYRAVVGMCGAMEALNDAGLMDTVMYNCGLSGSGWYLSAGYALEGISSTTQKTFHEGIRKRFNSNLLYEMVDFSTIDSYRNDVVRDLNKHDLPHTFVNYFPGYLVGKHIFGSKNLDVKLSDLANYVDSGNVPYPLLVALHVRNKVAANKFHAYVERSPHEIYFPSYGIGLNPVDEGSVWSNGFLTRSCCMEYPLHFTVGMLGCAFSILLNQYFKHGREDGSFLSRQMDRIRVKDRKFAKKDLDETKRVAEIESDDSEDDSESESESESDFDSDNDLIENKNHVSRQTSIEAAAASALFVTTPTLAPESNDIPIIARAIKNSEFFNSRNAFVGRTARLHNFALNYDTLKRYPLNPTEDDPVGLLDDDKLKLVKTLGHKCVNHDTLISTKKQHLSFVDAGIFKNVPTDIVLRPQRGTDVMIIMDFNKYASDDKFDYRPLFAAATHAWQSGLKFPKIDVNELLQGAPKEFLIFPSDDDDCPTVLWFTLSNKKFRDLKDYKPRCENAEASSSNDRPFNHFRVFGEDTYYSTFRFHYENQHFDQLRELMYYNVSSHVKEIKEALVAATERRRRRLRR